MMKVIMSPAAAAVLRVLAARSGAERNRILLMDVRSTDWQSLTFNGERHHFSLRLTGPYSDLVTERMCAGLEDAEFSIPGLVIADINVVGTPRPAPDGSIEVTIEALTIADD